MADGVMIVETRPSSPDEADAFHRWYDEHHIPEILQVEGFVSARRFASLDGESFLAVYEIQGDVATARARLAEARASGTMTPPVGVRLDPPPIVRWLGGV